MEPGRMPAECPCGAELSLDPWHWFSCTLLTCTAANARHNRIVSVLAQFVASAGGLFIPEPRGFVDTDGRRPDGVMALAGPEVATDVSVVHPGAASYRVAASKRRCAAADGRAKVKHGLYDTPARAQGMTFVPFVVESYRALHREAAAMVKCVAKAALEEAACDGGAPAVTVRGIRQRVAVALQRGNAWVIQQGERLALAARGEDYACVRRGGRRGRPPDPGDW